MKISVLMVSILLFAVIFIPLAYLVTLSSRTEKKAKKALLNLGKNNHLDLGEIDIHGNLLLGYDAAHHKLAVSTKSNPERDLQIIDIPSLTSCEIRTARNHGKGLEWVELELGSKEAVKHIVFYDENQDEGPVSDPMTSLMQAEKWKHRLVVA